MLNPSKSMPGLGDLVSDSSSSGGDTASLGSLGALPMLLRRFLALRRRLLLLDSSFFTFPSGSPLGVGMRETSPGVTGAEFGTTLLSGLAVSFTMFAGDGMVGNGARRRVGEWENGGMEGEAGVKFIYMTTPRDILARLTSDSYSGGPHPLYAHAVQYSSRVRLSDNVRAWGLRAIYWFNE